jgi:pyroglutamyl-peptidase
MKLIWKTISIIIIFLFFTSSLACNVSSIDFHTEPLKVIITGFEPFGVHEINPSQLIAETLDGQYINGAEIVGIVLPVDFDESIEILTQAIDAYNPTLVISTGLAARRHTIDVEKCGINLKRLSRNESMWFIPRRLDPCGPIIRLSPFNTREIVRDIRNAGIPSRQSVFAGLYVCNAVLYGSLSYICKHDLQTKVGFIHVPLLKSQDPNGMYLETMVEAVTIAIKTNLK